ncbi:MAG TPA: hypothetical protein VIM36_11990, partial [Gemmatimonadaceae bacterium]
TAKQYQSGFSVERPQRVIGEDDVGQEISDSQSELGLGLNAFSDGRQAGSMQRVPDKFGVGFAVFEHENTNGFCHRRGNR